MLPLVVVLLVIGILALVLELIMPGYDGFMGAIVGILALVASAVLAVLFVPWGWLFVGLNFTVLAICVFFGWQYIRRGQFHGKVVLSEALADDLPRIDLAGLIGKEGKTVTLLRPSGEVDFNGTRIEVTTTSGQMVERGTMVRVVETNANKVMVSVVNGN